MILRIEDLKEKCNMVLQATDNSDGTPITETLELITQDGFLYMNITNREYFMKVKLGIDTNEIFHATVNANLFLKLISKITSDTVELFVKDNALKIRCNGDYSLPLIYEGDNLLELPEIKIDNITSEMKIELNILKDILTYNSKEVNRNIGARHPIQNYYYVDDKGCITFTSSACINNFTLDKPIKILLPNKIVKLFKLFKEDVNFTLGYDPLNEEIIQTKIKLNSSDVELTAIISNGDALLNSMPAENIRNIASTIYSYLAVINRNELLSAINRLILFDRVNIKKAFGEFTFNKDELTIKGFDNKETLYCDNEITNLDTPYTCNLDLFDLKSTLEGYSDQYVNLNFGNNQSITITRANITNVIPEAH